MKTGLIVALVLCVAAATFFDPVKAEEEDAATQLGEDERLFSGNVEPLTRDLQGAEGANDADADATEATGTDLEQDPSEGMMRDLKTYHKYGPKTGYYPPYYKTGHYTPYYKTGHSKSFHGRRLSGYGGYYSPRYKGGYYHGYKGGYSYGHKGYDGRRLSSYGRGYGYGGYGHGYGYGGYHGKSYGYRYHG